MAEVSGAAWIARSSSDVAIHPVTVRSPAFDEALVRIVYAGLCPTDFHYFDYGATSESRAAPAVLGHEAGALSSRLGNIPSPSLSANGLQSLAHRGVGIVKPVAAAEGCGAAPDQGRKPNRSRIRRSG